MAKIRVYELARELGLESKDVLARVHELGIEAKTASSGLEPVDAGTVRQSYASTEEVQPVSEPEVLPEPEPEPEAETAAEPEPEPTETEDEPEAEQSVGVTVESGVTPEGLSPVISRPVTEIVQTLIQMGEMIGAVTPIPDDALELLADHFNFTIEITRPAPSAKTGSRVRPKKTYDDDPATLVQRPPVVTVMGHVDHGKTTLLDHIRHTNVVEGEHGGITQHIGAYQVDVGGNKITFLDTPGHEAFTALRARGAEVTDIVVLIVAADDGVMPQTIEAISHAKAARVPIIIAINKMDKPGADPTNIRAQLTEYELVAEELGGDITTVELSAKTGEGVEHLLEMIDLVAQLEEFKGNPKPAGEGVVVESQLDIGRGPVATVIVQRGTLRQGDAIVAGPVSGRVRSMLDEAGAKVEAAGPSTPVLVMGWSDVPTAGDAFQAVKNERTARNMAAKSSELLKADEMVIPTARERLAQLLEQLRTQDEADLRLIIRADAHGSLEAIRESIAKIGREGGKITTVQGAVGGISENDVSLAEVTESVIVGFNVRPDAKARRAAEDKGIEIRTYRVIYEMLDEIEQMLVGRLAPDEVEAVIGSAEVRALFRTPRAGTIAGSYITEGEITRGSRARVLRGGIVVHDGRIGSLRRFKEDVRQVSSGYECGIGFETFNDIKEGDVIEVYEVREVART
ncbi:MAG: translation initiation factor IF-2 [Acidimicrobiia bacterium]|nr:translation initiation factor IF-2 [Acidimicrobiia bacterium]